MTSAESGGEVRGSTGEGGRNTDGHWQRQISSF